LEDLDVGRAERVGRRSHHNGKKEKAQPRLGKQEKQEKHGKREQPEKSTQTQDSFLSRLRQSGEKRTIPPPKTNKRRGYDRPSKDIKDYLVEWLVSHARHPYPSVVDKRRMCRFTGLTFDQVNHWFINARHRLLGRGKRKPTSDNSRKKRHVKKAKAGTVAVVEEEAEEDSAESDSNPEEQYMYRRGDDDKEWRPGSE